MQSAYVHGYNSQEGVHLLLSGGTGWSILLYLFQGFRNEIRQAFLKIPRLSRAIGIPFVQAGAEGRSIQVDPQLFECFISRNSSFDIRYSLFLLPPSWGLHQATCYAGGSRLILGRVPKAPARRVWDIGAAIPAE